MFDYIYWLFGGGKDDKNNNTKYLYTSIDLKCKVELFIESTGMTQEEIMKEELECHKITNEGIEYISVTGCEVNKYYNGVNYHPNAICSWKDYILEGFRVLNHNLVPINIENNQPNIMIRKHFIPSDILLRYEEDEIELETRIHTYEQENLDKIDKIINQIPDKMLELLKEPEPKLTVENMTTFNYVPIYRFRKWFISNNPPEDIHFCDHILKKFDKEEWF